MEPDYLESGRIDPASTAVRPQTNHTGFKAKFIGGVGG